MWNWTMVPGRVDLLKKPRENFLEKKTYSELEEIAGIPAIGKPTKKILGETKLSRIFREKKFGE
jgi:hypothetical protein